MIAPTAGQIAPVRPTAGPMPAVAQRPQAPALPGIAPVNQQQVTPGGDMIMRALMGNPQPATGGPMVMQPYTGPQPAQAPQPVPQLQMPKMPANIGPLLQAQPGLSIGAQMGGATAPVNARQPVPTVPGMMGRR